MIEQRYQVIDDLLAQAQGLGETERSLIESFVSQFILDREISRSGFGVFKIAVKTILLLIRSAFYKNQYDFRFSKDPENLKVVLAWPWQKKHLEINGSLVDHGPLFPQLYFFSNNASLNVQIKQEGHQQLYCQAFSTMKIGHLKRIWSLYKVIKFTKKAILGTLGLSLRKWRKNYLIPLLELAPLYFQTFDVAQQLLGSRKIDFLLVGNPTTLVGSVGAKLAKGLEIPTGALMHGGVYGNLLYKYSDVDHFFTYGENDRRYLESIGFTKHIVVSGNPLMDHRFNQETSFTPLKEHLNITESFVVLAAFSGPGHSLSFQVYKDLLDKMKSLVQEHTDTHFIIKLHKKDKLDYYSDFTTLTNVTVVAFNNPYSMDILDWISSVDLVMSGFSTVVTEAMILKKPVVLFNNQEYITVPYVEEDCVYYATSLGQLSASIKSIRSTDQKFHRKQKNAQTHVKDFYANYDGPPATKRIGSYILKQIA